MIHELEYSCRRERVRCYIVCTYVHAPHFRYPFVVVSLGCFIRKNSQGDIINWIAAAISIVKILSIYSVKYVCIPVTFVHMNYMNKLNLDSHRYLNNKFSEKIHSKSVAIF